MPSVRSPQLWKRPALTCGEGAGRGASPGRSSLSPQQASVPSVLRPQLWKPPALTCGEGAGGRRGLSELVVAPASERPVRPEAAAVQGVDDDAAAGDADAAAGVDGDEGAGGG